MTSLTFISTCSRRTVVSLLMNGNAICSQVSVRYTQRARLKSSPAPQPMACSPFFKSKLPRRRVRRFGSAAMCMSISSVPSRADFGCQNVRTRRAWKQSSKKRIFGGSFSTHTACYLGNRARATRFIRLVIRDRGRPPLRAILTQADKSGAHTKVTLEIQLTENFTAILVSIFP